MRENNQCYRVEVPKISTIWRETEFQMPANRSFYMGQSSMNRTSQHTKRRNELTYTL